MDFEQAKPLLVAGIAIAVLVILRPANSSLAGISLNWIGVVIAAVGGLTAAFGN